MRVLLVEDDTMLQDLYFDSLTHEGYVVDKASDGEEGLEHAFKSRPDMILLDIMMPKMDGMTALHKLREDEWGKDVPVIILTNLDSNDKILQGVVTDHPSYYLIKANMTPAGIIEKIKEVTKTK